MVWRLLWDNFRRSENVEDYRDADKPVEKPDLSEFYQSINEMLKISGSELAKDLGAGDIKDNVPEKS